MGSMDSIAMFKLVEIRGVVRLVEIRGVVYGRGRIGVHICE